MRMRGGQSGCGSAITREKSARLRCGEYCPSMSRVAGGRQPVTDAQRVERRRPFRRLAADETHQGPPQPRPRAHCRRQAGQGRQHRKVGVREERERREDGADPRHARGRSPRPAWQKVRGWLTSTSASFGQARRLLARLLERRDHELLDYDLPAAPGVHHARRAPPRHAGPRRDRAARRRGLPARRPADRRRRRHYAAGAPALRSARARPM